MRSGSVPWRVRDAATFEALRRHGRSARAETLSVTWLPDDESRPPRVAYAIGSQSGSAVVRNRLRRRLRAQLAATALAPGAYLVRARPGAASLGAEELARDLHAALDALGARREVPA